MISSVLCFAVMVNGKEDNEDNDEKYDNEDDDSDEEYDYDNNGEEQLGR